MNEHVDEEVDDWPRQLHRQQKLRNEVEIGRKRLEEALGKAAKIPDPSKLPIKSQQERLAQLKTVLENQDKSGLEFDKYDGFYVRLFETDTIPLFEMTTKYFVEGTEEAYNVRKSNELYEQNKNNCTETVRYKTGFSQVVPAHTYLELILTDPIQTKEVGCSASNWLLYDAYNQEKTPEEQGAGIGAEEKEKSKIRNEVDKIFSEGSLKSFQQAAMITCRVLSSNTYRSQQIQFSKKHQPSRSIAYKMELLWNLAGPKSGAAQHICLNPSNSKIIGVGYGDREGPGTLKIWHVKNPETAEREISTKRAVTCLQFSKTQPRLLAATTMDGSILLVDITSHSTVHSVVNEEELSPYPEPLWALAWVTQDEGERLLTVGQSGLLWMWDPINKQQHKQIARLSFVAGPDPEMNVKFQKVLEECLDSDSDEETGNKDYFLEVPYIGLSISIREPHKIYVTTDVGCILCVNTRKAGNAWERLGGHKLAVFGMSHSPYIASVYLTHSADAEVCIWMHGIKEPLVHLRVSDLSLCSIDSAAWSPSHSSIIASASKEMVCIWDISRKTDCPMATLTGRRYTYVCFSDSGTNLLVGCDNGDVLVYRLSEMPHRPHLQKEHLEKALKKALERNPSMLDQLEIALSKI